METLESDEYVDWRGRSLEGDEQHVGIKGAVIACVVEILENMVFLSNASNFVSYFLQSFHYPPAQASNMVTNFSGTAFLLTIFGGFISDSFIPRCWTFILFGAIELLGLVILTIQASTARLQPLPGQKPSHLQEAILYMGMYAMALGVGGVKATLQAHGADQLDRSNERLISSFFNWFFFCLCMGGLLSSTFMVWIEENVSWKGAFSINIGAMSLALLIFTSGFSFYRNKRPSGSPLTRIFKVLLYTSKNWKASSSIIPDHNGRDANPSLITPYQNEHDVHSQTKLRFLNKAMAKKELTWGQVEETRIFLRLLPIFASTIMMNCCLAQLQTFSVQQGIIMNRKLGPHFNIPPASLTVIPLVFMLSSICLYERLAKVSAKKLPEKSKNFWKPLKRIGLGLALASGSMAIAAAVEVKRRDAAKHGDIVSVFWLGWQYLLLGVADMFTLGGMLEFFYSQAPTSMRSMSTALAWCSTSMGYFLSSLLVKISNKVTGHGHHHSWLGGKNLDQSRLDLFYTLLCILNLINFLNYVYWAKRY